MGLRCYRHLDALSALHGPDRLLGFGHLEPVGDDFRERQGLHASPKSLQRRVELGRRIGPATEDVHVFHADDVRVHLHAPRVGVVADLYELATAPLSESLTQNYVMDQ